MQLRLIASSDDGRCDGGPPQRPRQRDPCGGYLMLAGDLNQRVDDRPQTFLVANRRYGPTGELAPAFR